MSRKHEEITMVYDTDHRRRGDAWAIINCRRTSGETVRVKVSVERGTLKPCTEYRFYGRWDENGYGKTFVARSWAPQVPTCQEGAVRLLKGAPGIGEQTARRLWDAFGNDAVSVLIDDPKQAAAVVPRWSTERAQAAADYLSPIRNDILAHIELVDLLGGRGFPRTLVDAVIEKYGNRGPKLIRGNPFLLSRFSGAGFRRCDDLWIDLGLNPERLKRQTLCLVYALAMKSNGDIWHTPKRCTRILAETLSGASPKPQRAVRLGVRTGLLSVRRDDDHRLWIALQQHEIDERTIAAAICRAQHECAAWPSVDGPHFDELTDHQRNALGHTLKSLIAALVGSPGAGKTFTASRVLGAVVDEYGPDAVALCAPTGKAARRLTEMARGVGVPITARTIHSTLGVESVADDRWYFTHNADNPLPADFIVVDESSMIDTHIAAALLSARKPDAHVLFVGDPDQLSSVAPGRVLADLIAAGVTCGRLDEIRRNAGTIVRACRDIRHGRRFETDPKMMPARGHNFTHIPAPTTAESIRSVVRLATKLRDRRRADDTNFQVLCVTNDIRHKLNIALRQVFNPSGTGDFAAGDKVICLRNSMRPSVSGDNTFVCNGEIGTVSQAHMSRTEVIFPDPYRHVLFFDGDPLDLAYAITVHKSQGSEWDLVAVVLEDSFGAHQVTDRGWIYTAISRAKRGCWLIGKRSTADKMCGRQLERKTGLAERITEQMTCATTTTH